MRSRFRQEKRREGGESPPDRTAPNRPAFSRIRLSEVLGFPVFGCFRIWL
jgi:hypothetical protein